jgi:hypothetical protein
MKQQSGYFRRDVHPIDCDVISSRACVVCSGVEELGTCVVEQVRRST